MNRFQALDKFMLDNDLTPMQMADLSQIPSQSIRGYLRQDYQITDKKWGKIERAMSKYVKKVTVIKVIPQYILQSLEKFDNTIVMKKKIKKKEKEFIEDLKKLGYNCRLYDTGDDHYVIENKLRFPNKPLLLKNYKVIID